MRTFSKFLVGFIVYSAMASCKKENSFPANTNSPSDEIRSAPPGGNYWTMRQYFPLWISNAACFAINGKGYIVAGIVYGMYDDRLWEYDPAANTWTQKASIPSGVYRANASAFVINNKAYVVGGRSSVGTLDENWEYDPLTDRWTQRRSLPEPRTDATGFSINGKGYIATGSTAAGPRNDLLEYDPVLDRWSVKAPIPGTSVDNMTRNQAVSFVSDNKGYVATGTGPESTRRNDLWQYSPTTNSWSRKADMPTAGRYAAIGFAISSIGYVGTGIMPMGFSFYSNDFWSYNPSSNTWTRRADVPDNGRVSAIGFAIGSNGYVGMGAMESGQRGKFYRYTRSTVPGTTQ